MLLDIGSTGSINLSTVSVDGKSGNSFEIWEETNGRKNSKRSRKRSEQSLIMPGYSQVPFTSCGLKGGV